MKAAGERIGIASYTLSDLERGKRKIADATGISLIEITAKAGYQSKQILLRNEQLDW